MLKDIPHKLQWKFCGFYKVVEKIWTRAYYLKLLDSSKVHPMFYASLLKQQSETTMLQVPGDVELEDAQKLEYFKEDKILWWR